MPNVIYADGCRSSVTWVWVHATTSLILHHQIELRCALELITNVLYIHADLNECSLGTHLCEHNCGNNIGSYYCTCNTGYHLDGNGLNCSGIYIAKCVLYSHTIN